MKTNKKVGLITQDVYRFKRELMNDFETLKMLRRLFFELDDVCECTIKIDPVVANMVDKQQEEVYDKMTAVVIELGAYLRDGREMLYGRKEDEV